MDRIIANLAGWKGYVLASALCLALGFAGGWTVRDWKASADGKKAAEERVKVVERVVYRERAQADVTLAVEARATETQVQIRTVTQTIIKEVPVYVPAEADIRYAVPVGLVRVHDAAATGHPLPQSAGQPDDAAANLEPSEIPISRLASTLAENYGICRAELARFASLQEWVWAQRAVTNAE